MTSIRHPRRAPLAAVLFAFAVAHCAPKHAPVNLAPGEPFRIINGHTGQTHSVDALLAELKDLDVVYLGESHDNPHHHEAQLTILRAFAAAHPNAGLGMEMFQRPFQGPIDRYLKGEIGEVALLTQTEWSKRWGFAWDLYKPLLRFSREQGRSVVALNAPKELTKAISSKGLEGLSDEERKQLPELDLNNKEHRAFVREAFAGHPLPEERFEAFYAAQVTWDETMAESVHKFVFATPTAPRPMVVIAGTGHIYDRLGIPSRVDRRTPARSKIVLMLQPDEVWDALNDRAADWIWLTPEAHSSPTKIASPQMNAPSAPTAHGPTDNQTVDKQK